MAGEIIEGKEQLFVTLGHDYDLLESVHTWRCKRVIEFYENSVIEEKKMGFEVPDSVSYTHLFPERANGRPQQTPACSSMNV